MKGFSKKAIILYGIPGAGKGVIADLLANNLHYIHFDTGGYIRRIISFKTGKVIEREKNNLRRGKLCTPSWVLQIVKDKVKKISRADFGIIFSGSPRTIYEAFGQGKVKGLIEILQQLYGRKNIFIFKLEIKEETSISRNKKRLICSICGRSPLFLYSKKFFYCPYCGGKLIRRRDDISQSLIRKRIKEYKKRTQPVLDELCKKGFSIIKINGEGLPYQVFQRIQRQIPNA